MCSYFCKKVSGIGWETQQANCIRWPTMHCLQLTIHLQNMEERYVNKVILVGRTTRDVEVKHGDNESIFARFTLAVDRRFKKMEDEQTADFISCVAFGKIAEFLEKFGKKGVKFIVEGRIQTGSYTNKDGVKVYTSDVVVEHMEFAESKGTSAPDDAAFIDIPEEMIAEMPFR